jgi:predicted HTH transcriptional regulator
MPDPNPVIHGRGMSDLDKHGVHVDFFDADLREQIREENKDFIAYYEGLEPPPPRLPLPSYEGSLGSAAAQTTFPGASREECRPVPSATVRDLSTEAIQEYLEARGLPYQAGWREFFKKAQFLKASPDGRRLTPTLAGLVLFGSKPDVFFPQCKIKADCFGAPLQSGLPLESVKAQKDISGPLGQMVRDLVTFFQANVATVPHIIGAKRIEDTEYPLTVVREAIVNALVHRDYQEGRHVFFQMFRDSIVVKSPGTLLPPLTLEGIRSYDVVALSRNPRIADAMYHMGYMDGRAVGIPSMPGRLAKYGLREPDFACDLDYFVVTIYGRDLSPATLRIASETLSRLNLRQRRIIDIIGERGRITSLECIREFGITRETASQDFNRLLELGLITRMGTGRSTYYVGRF